MKISHPEFQIAVIIILEKKSGKVKCHIFVVLIANLSVDWKKYSSKMEFFKIKSCM